MQLTGGQSKFEFITNGNVVSEQEIKTEELIIDQIDDLPTIKSCKKDAEAHNERLSEIEKKYSLRTIWRKF